MKGIQALASGGCKDWSNEELTHLPVPVKFTVMQYIAVIYTQIFIGEMTLPQVYSNLCCSVSRCVNLQFATSYNRVGRFS